MYKGALYIASVIRYQARMISYSVIGDIIVQMFDKRMQVAFSEEVHNVADSRISEVEIILTMARLSMDRLELYVETVMETLVLSVRTHPFSGMFTQNMVDRPHFISIVLSNY